MLLLPSAVAEAGPAPAQVHTFDTVPPRFFDILRGHAQVFVTAKARAGYTLDTGDLPAGWFQIRYQGRAVMAVENASTGLVISLPAGVELLAPDVLQLRNHFRIWLEFGNDGRHGA